MLIKREFKKKQRYTLIDKIHFLLLKASLLGIKKIDISKLIRGKQWIILSIVIFEGKEMTLEEICDELKMTINKLRFNLKLCIEKLQNYLYDLLYSLLKDKNIVEVELLGMNKKRDPRMHSLIKKFLNPNNYGIEDSSLNAILNYHQSLKGGFKNV
jgi:hypothetical protein